MEILPGSALAAATTSSNVLNGESTDEESHRKVPEEFQRLASASVLYQDMEAIGRYFAVTDVEEQNGTTTIRDRDSATGYHRSIQRDA